MLRIHKIRTPRPAEVHAIILSCTQQRALPRIFPRQCIRSRLLDRVRSLFEVVVDVVEHEAAVGVLHERGRFGVISAYDG